MSTPRITRNVALAIALPGMLVATAFAGDRHHRSPDVDIESLRGELHRAGGEWLLEVRYDVEVEDHLPLPGELELILVVTDHGHALVDDTNSPIEYVVPLRYPSEEDDDELEFEDRITIALPDGAIVGLDHLRLEGIVVRAGDDHPLDRKDKSIKYERPKPSRCYSVSVSAGIGVGVTSVGHHRSIARHHRVVRHGLGVTHGRISIGHRRVGAPHHRITVGRHDASVSGHREAVHGRTSRAHRPVVTRHHRTGTPVRGRR